VQQFLQNNLSLIALVAISGAMLLWPAISRKISGVKEAGTLEATQLINHREAVVLDVREDKEFAAGHLLNALHIPLGQLKTRISEIEKLKGRPVVVMCRSGVRSVTGCRVLRNNGFAEVYNLKGGIIAWEQAKMPVER